LRLEFSARADHEIERALEWWREHRPDAPTMLSDELGKYFDRLKQTPDLGEPWRTVRGVLIRKVFLRRTKKKLYVTHPEPDVVRIICLWGAQHGRDPKL
jgi:hypothetical protein